MNRYVVALLCLAAALAAAVAFARTLNVDVFGGSDD